MVTIETKAKRGRKRVDPRKRFYAFVLKQPFGCWEWQGFIRPKGVGGEGYGQFHMGSVGKSDLAHRASWMLHRGPIPDGLQVLHKCDNRKCVRPLHLFLGTQQDNMDDASAKRRLRFGEANPSTRFDDLTIIVIRVLRSKGWQLSWIANWFQIGLDTIGRITNYRTRKFVW